MFEDPRKGRQARNVTTNVTTNVSKILDFKSSSELNRYFPKIDVGCS